MEEADLLRERLQAITDKHCVQEDIRVKKQELDQEKVKLQYLKKTSLRERWLLEDLSSHNALQQQKVVTDQQKTRTLQNNIHRIEKEVEFLEREESRISTNENLILKTLRAVERRPNDIIKINVCTNLLTGEVVSMASTATPQDRLQGVQAVEPQQGSHDLSCREVEQLLRAALGNHQDEYRHRNQPFGRCHGNQQPINNHMVGDHQHGTNPQETSQRRPGDMHLHGYQETRERNLYDAVEKSHGPGHRHANRHPPGYRDYNGNQGNPAQTKPAVSTNRGPAPRSHDQEAVSPWRPELCYTPANHIPLRDYVTVDNEELYLYSPPSCPSFSQSEASPNGDSQSTAFFYGPAQSKRAPSPLYEADTPFTILSAMETSEPITAVFLGFQTTQDESGCGQEYEGCLKAELVIIDDANSANGASSMVEEKVGYPAGVGANHTLGQEDKGRATGSGSRKIHKQYKACCAVC